MVNQEQLKAFVHYNPETGVFVRLIGAKTGAVAGGVNSHGYTLINVNGRSYRAHRLAWLYIYGVWPKQQIDHVNNVRTDNRISNLREATQSQNKANTGAYVNNTSGHKGVSWDKSKNKWYAKIRMDGKQKYLGLFTDINAAVEAYKKAAELYHGEFKNLTMPKSRPGIRGNV